MAAGVALAAGLAEGATEGEAVGAVAGATEAAAEGDGDGDEDAGTSFTTERGPVTPGSENSSASNIKIPAEIIVAFSSGFCAPRGPKAV